MYLKEVNMANYKTILNKYLHNYFLNRKRNFTTKYELPDFRKNAGTIIPLTKSEKKEIDNKRKVLNTSATYDYWLMYKNFVGFNSDYIADDDFMPQILRVLNPNPYYKALQYKGFYPLYFNELKKPNTIINYINGVFYDSNNKIINCNDENIKNIFQSNDSFIIKSTKGTCGGGGVRIINYNNLKQIIDTFKQYGNDFICQEIVKQSPKTKCFNPSSLNTFRVSTLNINGKCSLATLLFRHGKDGNIVDNGGAGGIMVGINPKNGRSIKSFDMSLMEYKQSPSGINYDTICFDFIDKMIQIAINAHKYYLPNMGFAGWDFCLDENNDPVFIEVNLGYPGILYEQLCSATPIFGERTLEIYEYVGRNLHKLYWKDDFIGSAL